MIARLIGANKLYKTPDGRTITALEKTDLELKEGELLLIIGPSGSGKTTVLSLLGCLIDPSEGSVIIDDNSIDKLSQKEMASIRLNMIGFVFQQFNLLAPLSAEENVAFPLRMQKRSSAEIRQQTEQALSKVNMTPHRSKLPKQLSGGEQQRIAIARALVTNPRIVLCDEPTASLDKDSVDTVMKELVSLARSGKAMAVVTHDQRLYQYADRVVEVKNGIVSSVTTKTS
jgi:putative ABC transport system ATP-binding protein